MKCSFSPLIQAKATQNGREDPSAVKGASLAQKDPNCTMHGTGLDDCIYKPAASNVSHDYDKTYFNNATTNATYALSQKDPNCTMHGTGVDDCSYKPAASNVSHDYDKTYFNNATTNATYALSQDNCNEHQDNAMKCSFSPLI